MKNRKSRKEKIRYVSLVGEPEKRWYHKKKRKIQTVSFMAVLYIGMIVSLLIPLRPDFSESEKRELAKFPVFTAESFFEGEYFSQIDTWFADTFPFRELLTSANSKLTSWYGFGDKVSSLNNVVADDIPEIPTTTQTESTTQSDETESTTEADTTESTSATTTTQPDTTAATDKDTGNTKPQKTEALGGILIAGNSAYEYYNFVQSVADSYVGHISSLAAVAGKSDINVYAMIVPTSIDIVLDGGTRSSIQSSDQKKAIEYMYASMQNGVKTINIYDTLTAHKDEYIYFRTDHHWTALGAYYGYTELMRAKGLTPLSLEKDFKKADYGEFLGSFYTDTDKNKKLEKKPDKLIAYVPEFKNEMYFFEADGDKIIWPLVHDVSDYPVGYKYSAFAGGDNKYTRIQNPDSKNKENCIVVKESFGNAMLPFIAGNYRNVYVIDYRYWDGSLTELAKEKKATDIIFINNISATRNQNLITRIGKLCK